MALLIVQFKGRQNGKGCEMIVNHVSAIGLFILLVVAAVCLYWNDRNMRQK
jgi:hypothetical protein